MATYQLRAYTRLAPKTVWSGGRISDVDVLTLAEAAAMASTHAAVSVTENDFLRAAGRGEIPLRAVLRRPVTMKPCRDTDTELSMPLNSIPTLPATACQSLANIGHAAWRHIDGYDLAGIAAQQPSSFVRWALSEGEEDIVTALEDCRVTGYDVHALADAFLVQVKPTVPAAPNFKPVTRLNTSRGPSLETHYDIKKPEWDRWQKLDIVELWQAVCLLVDIDPPNPGGKIWATYQLTGLPKAFHDAWEVVNADSYFSKLEILQYSGRMLWKVHLAGFAKWASDKGLKLPAELTSILDSSAEMQIAAQGVPVDTGLSKREQQIRAIESAIKQLGYNPKSIPNGGKTKIGTACKSAHANLFGAGKDPFLDAWKDAVKQGRLRMANHEQYAKKKQ